MKRVHPEAFLTLAIFVYVRVSWLSKILVEIGQIKFCRHKTYHKKERLRQITVKCARTPSDVEKQILQ